MAYSDYKGSFDILSISSYTSHSGSEESVTPKGMIDDSCEFCIEDFLNPEAFLTPEAVAATAATATATTEPYPHFDPNDPLRYFLELGEITTEEYEKWKLVKEEPTPRHKRKTPDFGPGYNSDSDTDGGSDDQGPIIVFGDGYSVHADEYNDPLDPWNPTPDTTNDRRYTNTATSGEYMLSRLTQPVEYDHSATGPGNKRNLQLSDSFHLKLTWERFAMTTTTTTTTTTTSKAQQRLQTLQDFWQANALMTYEAIQDLRAAHARVHTTHAATATATATPEYHSTPIETLENTFETIGRMSRCIAEDFNTQSVVNYVEEFFVTLYREIEFNALVEAHENKRT
jgi:hypothetical protein